VKLPKVGSHAIVLMPMGVGPDKMLDKIFFCCKYCVTLKKHRQSFDEILFINMWLKWWNLGFFMFIKHFLTKFKKAFGV
jgi:hypothetical protein